jgi:hypothetical protein
MPRYFFIVAYPDQREIVDPDGTPLPNDTSTVEFARRVIDDLREDRLPGEPLPTIIMKNDAERSFIAFPAIERFPNAAIHTRHNRRRASGPTWPQSPYESRDRTRHPIGRSNRGRPRARATWPLGLQLIVPDDPDRPESIVQVGRRK